MFVENIKLKDIKPYEHNTKVHDQKQIDNVAESIRRFGFVQPLVIDGEGTIVIGHARALAREQLGMDEVPCVRVDDLSEEEVRILRIADNKTNESPWDFEELTFELGDLDFDGFEFDFNISDVHGTDDYLEEQREVDWDKARRKAESRLHTCPNCGFEFEE